MQINELTDLFYNELLFEPKELVKILGPQQNKYLSDIRLLPFHRIMEFCDYFGITSEEFLNLDFKFDRIKSFIRKDFDNDQYLNYSGTFLSNLVSSLKFLEQKINKNCANHLLLKLGVHRKQMLDEKMVSLDLGNDIYDLFVSDFNFNTDDLYMCGRFSYDAEKRKNVLPLFKNCFTEVDIVKKIVEFSNIYEQNFKYELVENQHEFKVISYGKIEAHDAYRKKIICNDPVTVYKAGVFIETPAILGRPRLRLKKINNDYIKGRQVTEFIFEKNRLSNFSFLH